MAVKYGLYDTLDKVWMGDKDGPLLFDPADDIDPMMGQVRAMMVDAQLGQRQGRTRAMEYTEQSVRLRDEVEVERDPLTALTMLEEGQL